MTRWYTALIAKEDVHTLPVKLPPKPGLRKPLIETAGRGTPGQRHRESTACGNRCRAHLDEALGGMQRHCFTITQAVDLLSLYRACHVGRRAWIQRPAFSGVRESRVPATIPSDEGSSSSFVYALSTYRFSNATCAELVTPTNSRLCTSTKASCLRGRSSSCGRTHLVVGPRAHRYAHRNSPAGPVAD